MLTNAERAVKLLALHHQNAPLLLPNAWNPITARILEKEKFPAIATASAAVSASLGYADGEVISWEMMLGALKLITSSVSIPVTADIERGYARNHEELRSRIADLIEIGVSGINIEDSVVEGESLFSVDEQVTRINTIRDESQKHGVHLVINARVDTFISNQYTNPIEKMQETLKRAAAYKEGGADCIYPIIVTDAPLIKKLVDSINLPVNILGRKGGLSVSQLHDLGVKRISFGPGPFRATYSTFIKIIREVSSRGAYDLMFENSFDGSAFEQYLRQSLRK